MIVGNERYKKNSQALQKELLRQDAKEFYGFMLIIFSPLIIGCFLGLCIGWIIWG
jgi:hypothetical protein